MGCSEEMCWWCRVRYAKRIGSGSSPGKQVAARSSLALSALAWACLPEHDLASYDNGVSVDASVAVSSPLVEADAGSRGGPYAASLYDAAPAFVEAATDAAVPRLDCRAECSCELRAGQDFMLCGSVVSQDLASQRCSAAGGSLVSIDDSAENAWLSERMAALAEEGFWTSGTDSQTEGQWRWADGRLFFDARADAATSGFAPWDVNQPNDLDGEDCLRAIGGLWRDLDCGDEIAYVCEL